MIWVNDKLVTQNHFPDGTSAIRLSVESCPVSIRWYYDNDGEAMVLWNIVHHIRSSCGANAAISLHMPYIPNARMDRVKNGDEVFTLKWFANFINALNFSYVAVTDPHSNVGVALINNVYVVQPDTFISAAAEDIGGDLLFCYPDEGAAKRYSELMKAEYIFGIKHRDWRTGKIERLELTTPDKVAGRNILIVDDICSRGGTFLYTAKALKEAGANKVYLYVTHCENSVFDGDMISSGLIEHIYTTDSIYRGNDPRITVI